MKAPGGDETSAEKALEVVVDEADAAPGGKARGAAGQMPVGPGVPCKDDGSGILWPAGRSCRSLHEHVLVHGNTDPSREAVIWLGDSGAVEGRRTYGDLLARARAVAYRLTKKYKVGRRSDGKSKEHCASSHCLQRMKCIHAWMCRRVQCADFGPLSC
eukprot:144393-Chlamydomonas_euryale.AAC.1